MCGGQKAVPAYLAHTARKRLFMDPCGGDTSRAARYAHAFQGEEGKRERKSKCTTPDPGAAIFRCNMIYICLDTNVYIRLLSQGRPGCEPRHFDDLQTLVQGKAATLLVPEVVLLELQKEWPIIKEKIHTELDTFTAEIKKIKIWNEVEDVKGSCIKAIDEQKKAKAKQAEGRYRAMDEFLTSNLPTVIKFTPDILFRAKRRMISGRMPRTASEADCMIWESLQAFFETNGQEPDARLYFCSENHNDFAVSVEMKNERVFSLHPALKAGMPQVHYVLDLEQLLRFARGADEPDEPTIEAIEEALEKKNKMHPPPVEDFDDDRAVAEWIAYNEAWNSAAIDEFRRQTMPTLPEQLVMHREQLAKDIEALLHECRACKSWGDKSESKLMGRLEYVPAAMMPYTSLARLIRIKGNVEAYLRTHRQMDEELAARAKT